jgi:hypothetical protein
MEYRFQIRTSVIQERAATCQKHRLFTSSHLRFPTDSKRVSSLLSSTDIQRSSPDSAFLGIGLGRAFTEVPPDNKVLQPQAARREL